MKYRREDDKMKLIDRYIAKGAKTASRIIDGEAIVIRLGNIEDRILCTLSSTGTRLWSYIEGRVKVRDVIKRLTDDLDVDYEESKEDLLNYIKNLIDQELLDVFDSPK